MNRTTQPATSLSDPDIEKLADDFETREFTPAELTKIKKTRRRKPRLGEAKAEVYTFRAPPNYKSHIKNRLDEVRYELANVRRLNARRPDWRAACRTSTRNWPTIDASEPDNSDAIHRKRVTDTIGQRPVKGGHIRAWDNVTGYLDQHQSAPGVTAGLGPIQGPGATKALLHNRALAARSANKLTQTMALAVTTSCESDDIGTSAEIEGARRDQDLPPAVTMVGLPTTDPFERTGSASNLGLSNLASFSWSRSVFF